MIQQALESRAGPKRISSARPLGQLRRAVALSPASEGSYHLHHRVMVSWPTKIGATRLHIARRTGLRALIVDKPRRSMLMFSVMRSIVPRHGGHILDP